MARPPAPPDFEPVPADIVDGGFNAGWRRIAGRFAGRTALATGDARLTYSDLDRASAHVARRLADGGYRSGHVALLTEPVPSAVIAAIGVLRSGNAFVPLDPGQPADRNGWLLKDAEASCLLSGAGRPAWAGDIPILDVAAPGDSAARTDGIDPVDTPPDARAYLLYTSGSTGRPKGVPQSVRAVLHNVFKYVNALSLSPSDRHSLLGSLSHAASMTDLFGTLLSGGCLCGHPLRESGVTDLADWLARERVTVLATVPTVFRRWIAAWRGAPPLPELRLLKLSGEPVMRDDVEAFRRLFPPSARLLHSLGSTELNTIRQFFVDRDTPLPDGGRVPVGYAVPDTDVDIVDGEIVVENPYLPAGYWRDPDLSSRVFHPGVRPGWRRFRTGDRGRLLDGGLLLHEGRLDDRIKRNGVTVEPAEIEHALRTRGGAHEAAVVERDDPPRLVAFLAGPALPEEDLRGLLARILPRDSIPSRFVRLEALPRTPGGKTDRRELAGRPLPRVVEPAADDTEARLLDIWKRVLRLEEVGALDRFDELGGGSLQAAEVAAAAAREWGVAWPPSILWEAPTVRALAARIRAGPDTGSAPALAILRRGSVRSPLFLVPGAGSDVSEFRHLVSHWPSDDRLYGLRMRGLDGESAPDESMDAMADYLAGAVLAAHPRGPYRLAGRSFGGCVAVEIARRLRHRGETVDWVALLDTAATGGRSAAAWLRHPLHMALLPFLPLGSQHRLDWNTLRLGWREFRQRRFPSPAVARFFILQEACRRVLRRYRPAPYDGPVVLLRAVEQPPWLRDNRTLGWAPFLSSLEVIDTPGGHPDQLNEAGAAIVANHLANLAT